MSPSDVSAVLLQALSPVVSEQGLYLEEVAVGGSGRNRTLIVVIDLPEGPGGVSSDQLAEVSRAVSNRLDDVDHVLRGPYQLEVTTPGISRPLTQPRHFGRAVGRLATVTTTEGIVRGRIVAADDDGLQVQQPPNRRGAPAPEPLVLTWDEVRQGTVEVEFGSPADA
ncbi:ribosome maturation factor RimP [Pseudactinotalea sp. Z1739]|uniref:ribosome maturation factor RimP n=1 Tax=Pseudactinotalea sp. Z1739 TaxID=3413028 RepID=UPI003C7AE65E